MAPNDTNDALTHMYRYARTRVTPITRGSVISVIGPIESRSFAATVAPHRQHGTVTNGCLGTSPIGFARGPHSGTHP
jgi:hypothetical protein